MARQIRRALRALPQAYQNQTQSVAVLSEENQARLEELRTLGSVDDHTVIIYISNYARQAIDLNTPAGQAELLSDLNNSLLVANRPLRDFAARWVASLKLDSGRTINEAVLQERINVAAATYPDVTRPALRFLIGREISRLDGTFITDRSTFRDFLRVMLYRGLRIGALAIFGVFTGCATTYSQMKASNPGGPALGMLTTYRENQTQTQRTTNFSLGSLIDQGLRNSTPLQVSEGRIHYGGEEIIQAKLAAYVPSVTFKQYLYRYGKTDSYSVSLPNLFMEERVRVTGRLFDPTWGANFNLMESRVGLQVSEYQRDATTLVGEIIKAYVNLRKANYLVSQYKAALEESLKLIQDNEALIKNAPADQQASVQLYHQQLLIRADKNRMLLVSAQADSKDKCGP